MNSIPASNLANIQPAVVGTGGSPLSLNTVVLTNNTSIPIGTVQPFSSYDTVASWFGAASDCAKFAQKYFLGFDNSTIKPGTIYFTQFASAAVAAYLRSGSLSGMTLAQLQAIASGPLTLTVDGTEKVSSSISLSGATSFSNAATLLTAGFISGLTFSYDSQLAAFKAVSTTTGDESTIAFATGDLAIALKFTSATGAVLSQGADASVPSDFMAGVKAATQNWGVFTTIFEPITADKLLFADWVNGQNQRYQYAGWDSDATAVQAGNTTSFGPLCAEANYDGVICLYPSYEKAAFYCGMVASIDFTRTNGRITFAHKHQSGLEADVVDETTYKNLLANGYNFYARFGTGNDEFTLFEDGRVPGQWSWSDPYINQIRINSQFQLALMTLLSSVNSLPYNAEGYAMIERTLQDPIDEALNFGSIRSGVTLSSQQAAIVNMQAGVEIDKTLEQKGYYLQVLDATAQTRGLRESPPITFWYMDGGSIHKITMPSISVQ